MKRRKKKEERQVLAGISMEKKHMARSRREEGSLTSCVVYHDVMRSLDLQRRKSDEKVREKDKSS